MRRPFGKLMDMVDELTEEEMHTPIGELAKRWNEDPERIMDAIDACKERRGEPSYLRLPRD